VSSKKKRRSKIFQTDIPSVTLDEALRIPSAIIDNYAGEATKPLDVAAALDMSPSSGRFRTLCGASIGYGLTIGGPNATQIELTPLANQILIPLEDGVSFLGKVQAVLNPTIINNFLTKYNNMKLPALKIAFNVLESMGVPKDSTKQVHSMIVKSANSVNLLTEIKGSTYVNLDKAKSEMLESAPVLQTENYTQPADVEEAVGQTPSISTTKLGSVQNQKVFITHGKNRKIVDQIKTIIAFGKYKPVLAVEEETPSIPISQKVLNEMRSCYAAIIHVGKEQELLGSDGSRHLVLNQNVLIEIGIALALYDQRFILLVQKGVKLPSNLQGLYEVRYEGDTLNHEATMKLLKAFNNF